MSAAVAPAEATNQNVTWSVVAGTRTATISAGGALYDLIKACKALEILRLV